MQGDSGCKGLLLAWLALCLSGCVLSQSQVAYIVIAHSSRRREITSLLDIPRSIVGIELKVLLSRSR